MGYLLVPVAALPVLLAAMTSLAQRSMAGVACAPPSRLAAYWAVPHTRSCSRLTSARDLRTGCESGSGSRTSGGA